MHITDTPNWLPAVNNHDVDNNVNSDVILLDEVTPPKWKGYVVPRIMCLYVHVSIFSVWRDNYSTKLLPRLTCVDRGKRHQPWNNQVSGRTYTIYSTIGGGWCTSTTKTIKSPPKNGRWCTSTTDEGAKRGKRYLFSCESSIFFNHGLSLHRLNVSKIKDIDKKSRV